MAFMVSSASSFDDGSIYGTIPRPRGANAFVSGIIDHKSFVSTSFSRYAGLWLMATSSMGWVWSDALYAEPFPIR